MSSGPSRPRFVDTNASVLLDLLRGLAGLLVLVSHLRNTFFVDYPQLNAHRLLMIVPYTIAGAGHQAVVVFFVLSGYFISQSVFQSVARGRWSWSDYLLRRFVRLWLVLIPALILCLFWDKLGLHLHHGAPVYQTISLSPLTWFGNVFFLQTILVPFFGSNGPLWSIANEFWYYILFPLAYLAIRPAVRIAPRVLYLALLAAFAVLVHGVILQLFPIWLAGTLLAKLPPPCISSASARRALTGYVPFYLLCFFACSRQRNIPSLVADYTLAVITFGLIWLILAITERARPQAMGVRMSRETARFSYSLYAVHDPVVIFASTVLLTAGAWFPTPGRVFEVCGLCLGIVVYAYGVAAITEFRTDPVRRFLERTFGLPDPRSALASDPAQIAKGTTAKRL